MQACKRASVQDRCAHVVSNVVTNRFHTKQQQRAAAAHALAGTTDATMKRCIHMAVRGLGACGTHATHRKCAPGWARSLTSALPGSYSTACVAASHTHYVPQRYASTHKQKRRPGNVGSTSSEHAFFVVHGLPSNATFADVQRLVASASVELNPNTVALHLRPGSTDATWFVRVPIERIQAMRALNNTLFAAHKVQVRTVGTQGFTQAMQAFPYGAHQNSVRIQNLPLAVSRPEFVSFLKSNGFDLADQRVRLDNKCVPTALRSSSPAVCVTTSALCYSPGTM